PPGAWVAGCAGRGVGLGRCWQVASHPAGRPQAGVDEVEPLLRQAVRRRLESDVPLGVFLSAGYDSGLVAAFAAQESPRPLVAVTAGTRGSGYDERGAAALVAQRNGFEHHPLEVLPL